MNKKLTLFAIAVLVVLCLIGSAALAADDSGIEKVQILTVNDFHGALSGSAKEPGFAKLGAYIQQQKANYPDSTLILSAGDMFQGTMDSNLLYGAPVISIMNYLGFDAMALGNHEFDWGIDNIRKRAVQAKFPIMAANIINDRNKKAVDFCVPTVIVRRGDVKIGIIAYDTQETPTTTSPANTIGLDFTAPALTAMKYAAILRKQGADIIVVLSHMGCEQGADGSVIGEAADFARKVQGIDLIVCGHTHKIVNGVVNGIPLVQAFCNGKALGDVVFDYSLKDRKIIRTDARVIDTATLLKAQPDANIEKILKTDLQEIQPVKSRIIGVSVNTILNRPDGAKFGQTLMGEFVTDIMRDAVKADMAFTNIGGLRASIEKGDITLGGVYAVLPFDNTIVTCSMTGSQIMQLLNYSVDNTNIGSVQYSGLRIVYNPALPAGSRLVSVKLNDGSVLQPDKIYKVATNDFMSIGGDGYTMFASGKNMLNTNIPLRDYVDNEIIKIKTVKVTDDGRFSVVK